MKLKLPHKTYNLDMEASIDERMMTIENILAEVVDFHERSMTVEEYFRETWTKQNTIMSMDIIGYYLTKESRNLDVLSTDKQQEMLKGSQRHTTFSGMGYDNQLAFGLNDIDEH